MGGSVPGVVVALVAVITVATAQTTPAAFRRKDRVVVYSPHFDVVPKPYGGLNCPPQPLRLFGFEGGVGSDSTTSLAVRVFSHKTAAGEPALHPLSGAVVWLAASLVGDHVRPLPAKAPWAVLSDSSGRALLRVPSRLYRIIVRALGFPSDTGVVRLRSGSADSLHALVHSAPIC